MKSKLHPYDFLPVDWHLANTIAKLSSGSSDELRLAIALVSKRCREGHVCASLAAVAGLLLSETELGDPNSLQSHRWPPLEVWLNKLLQSGAVTQPGRLDPARPLVLAAERLYLNRYYFHERALAQRVLERIEHPLEIPSTESTRAIIEQHFVPLNPASEKQRLAIAIALLSRLCIITGGPGTGKTSTIVRLLAVLVQKSLSESNSKLRLLLLAPTGKAASRIADSICESKARLGVSDEIKACIPNEAFTIHRALGLGSRLDHSNYCKLAADIVAVDEASMVDLALMRRLFDACSSVPRLILLGDPEQLESVLAGSVLAELSSKVHMGYSRLRAEQFHAVTALEVPVADENSNKLDDCRVELTESHRFAPDSVIGKLSQAVRHGQGEAAWQVLSNSKEQTRFIELTASSQTSLNTICELAAAGYRSFYSARDPATALATLKQFRVLCAHRTGPLGVESINAFMSNSSLARQYRSRPSALPILITENASELSLYNGDVGVLYSESAAEPGRKAYFPGSQGQLRVLSSNRLPLHELAFAMTVHKMQGSELDNVLIVLPRANSPLLTRELIYTAITRARRSCVLCGTHEAFIQGCLSKSERLSGLSEALGTAPYV